MYGIILCIAVAFILLCKFNYGYHNQTYFHSYANRHDSGVWKTISLKRGKQTKTRETPWNWGKKVKNGLKIMKKLKFLHMKIFKKRGNHLERGTLTPLTISAVKFAMDCEKNMSFLVITKSPKVWEGESDKIGLGSFNGGRDWYLPVIYLIHPYERTWKRNKRKQIN